MYVQVINSRFFDLFQGEPAPDVEWWFFNKDGSINNEQPMLHHEGRAGKVKIKVDVSIWSLPILHIYIEGSGQWPVHKGCRATFPPDTNYQVYVNLTLEK